MRIADVIAMTALTICILIALIIVASLRNATSGLGTTTYQVSHTAWVKFDIFDDCVYENFSDVYLSAWNALNGSTSEAPPVPLVLGQQVIVNGGTNYYIYRVGLFFDLADYEGWTPANITSYTVTAAKLELFVITEGAEWADNITIQADLTPPINEHPALPIAERDYNRTYYSGNLGTLNVTGLSPLAVNITLNPSGLSFINAVKDSYAGGEIDGLTFMLRSSSDIAGTEPTGDHAVSIEGVALMDGGTAEALYVQLQWFTTATYTDPNYSAASNTLFSNAWTGLTLASIGIIITAAVGILALVLTTLGRSAGGGVA